MAMSSAPPPIYPPFDLLYSSSFRHVLRTSTYLPRLARSPRDAPWLPKQHPSLLLCSWLPHPHLLQRSPKPEPLDARTRKKRRQRKPPGRLSARFRTRSTCQVPAKGHTCLQCALGERGRPTWWVALQDGCKPLLLTLKYSDRLWRGKPSAYGLLQLLPGFLPAQVQLTWRCSAFPTRSRAFP